MSFSEMNDIESRYIKVFHSATEHDENGQYGTAAGEYKEAAGLLMEYINFVDENERGSLLLSVKRLMDQSEEMKRLAQTSAKTAASKSSGKDKGEDEIEFTPTAEHPNIHFEDIAGLEEAKRIIRHEIQQPRQHAGLYDRFKQNTNGGILLYGLPGTGKTMLAKCIATEIKADFFPISCSDIVSKWFGEAEQRVKALFEAARKSENAIVFFDEFDALAAKRGGNSTVMNRLVPELLTQMDGFTESKGKLTVIAATNTPWAIDTAFLRYPRLSHHICVPLPDEEARRYMFEMLLKDMPIKGEIDLNYFVNRTEGFTCADIRNLVNESTRAPIDRGIESGNEEQYLTEEDLKSALAYCNSSIQPEDVVKMGNWVKNHAARSE